MAKRVVKTKATRAEVVKLIRDLPGILTGTKKSGFAIHKIFWGAVAHSLFTSITEAYVSKSQGGADDLGNDWEDLTQYTKAYKVPANEGNVPQSIVRRRKKNLKGGAGNRTGLGILTPGEYKEWRRIFGVIYHSYKDKYGEVEAKQMAGQIAWTQLKEAGASTMWDVLGNRTVLILRRTDRLIKSLSPGNFDPSSGYRKSCKDQIFILSRGKIILGTNVPYAEMHNKTRPIWPENIDEWLDKAVEAGTDAIYERLGEILE